MIIDSYSPDQAEAMAAATTVATYIDGDREVITVMTRCGPPSKADDPIAWEATAEFWLDGHWIVWVEDTYRGWMWARGSGQFDQGGEWFAQEHRQGDDFIWLAVGTRPALGLEVPEGWSVRKYEDVWELLHACGDDGGENNITTITKAGDLYEVDGIDEALGSIALQETIDYIVGDHQRVGCVAG